MLFIKIMRECGFILSNLLFFSFNVINAGSELATCFTCDVSLRYITVGIWEDTLKKEIFPNVNLCFPNPADCEVVKKKVLLGKKVSCARDRTEWVKRTRILRGW